MPETELLIFYLFIVIISLGGTMFSLVKLRKEVVELRKRLEEHIENKP